jgi:multiple sugar transport system permease protein
MDGPRRSLGARIGRWAIVVGFATILAFPFYWMAITTFKQTGDLYNVQNDPFIFNAPPTLEHLRLLFEQTLFLRWFWNTTIAGAAVVAITLVLAVPAAWALARLTGRWGQQLGIGIFLT